MSDQVEIPDISDLPDMQEAAEFTPAVKLLTTETPVLGYDGANINPANWQAKALADRTQWLRDRLLNLSTRLVLSVNGRTGSVVVTYADTGADAAGTADGLMTAHLTALDPHPQYFDETRGDTRYVQRSLANQSNGWLQLDAAGKIPAAMLQTLASRYVVVANQAARLALASSANLTICAQADIDQLFYLNGGANPSVAANWVAGQSATVSGVSSVFGRTGAVTAQAGDYDADKITETATRKFATTAEKTAWNAKQVALVSGTNIRSLFGQSLLGSGNLTPTPAQMGTAAAVHTHTTADITDYTQKTQQLITASLEAGTGVTLGYNPVSGKTIISAIGGSGGGSGYIVVDRPGASAGQLHTFNINAQSAFDLAAFALKEETGTANVTVLVDDFNASSESNYNATNAVIFDGTVHAYTGGIYELTDDSGFYSAPARANAKALSVRSVDYAVPVMLSDDTPSGFAISASSYDAADTAPHLAFNRISGGFASRQVWFSSTATVGRPPQWLRVDMPTATEVFRYEIAGRSDSSGGFTQRPTAWKIQGSNDGLAWNDLDSRSSISWSMLGEIKTFDISNPASYSKYRILVSAVDNGPNVGISMLNLFDSSIKMLVRSNSQSRYYSVLSGMLIEVEKPISESDFNSGFNNSGEISGNELANISPFSIVSASKIKFKEKFTPYQQIVIHRSLIPATTWSQINAATLTATQTGNGKVRVAVTRDLVSWHVWRSGAWVDVGALSTDTAGATALISDGMTPTELGAITAAQWTQLFASNNGVPDSLAFAFALDIPDPLVDVAAIDRLLLNVNNTSSWKLQNPAEVEIRWRNDSMTFRTMTAGNYKLAYQIP
ncbi:discoidin domain-containing protein [Pectobacterium carotovorum]|uniref:discoidin domain-containing protein n=1 Tax=Pectobacterium carotovorum TaxID=554 RepID=UPI000D73AACE|nr:discoidin domain-containing protein [Pectobacterium carotovorum]PXB01107.1 carbohydrate-binding protein [Pectobacterium carotovorum subsp. carotovorum]